MGVPAEGHGDVPKPRKPKRNAKVKYCGTGLHSLYYARLTRSMIAWNHRRTVYCAMPGRDRLFRAAGCLPWRTLEWPSRRRCGAAARVLFAIMAGLVIGKPLGLMSAPCARGVDEPCASSRRSILRSTRRCRCIGRYWVYHVIVHRWPSIPDTSRLWCRKVAVFSASV
jgi:hypothetical protein